ncbi:glucuronosyltransferase [Rhizobium leguminosarum]|uniref:Glucuronosyltransferase n=1 Tax=Rhizobium leguminosarum TaxID=384 RepID=A0ABD7PV75_RHILE|nr:glucuronosyltransferase [Rhizobium leguminosarum]QND12939.1 glucuronosyltransferase [Rhizobium leguminosarum bv. trifolii]RWY87861.1 glucuronosyltransferase [Rhizobium leguminosarum]TAV75024.1 glucuronosyltransferase [Rhizobium leguminosarum]TAV79624.1 glucuronosyltransferase [Rhizobium leguminosarum]TAW30959.1 glucuronosyltransferase [Rhizobium leguminosarum]
MADKKLKVLAASSGGGHWEQLMAMRGAFEGCDIVFATTIPGLLAKYDIRGGLVLPDCSRDSITMSIRCFFTAFSIVIKQRPDVIISTGAAPGLFCLLAGKLTGKRTIWIDSVANVEKLSLSGKLAGHIATLWLTQWQHLSRPDGPHYAGAVL